MHISLCVIRDNAFVCLRFVLLTSRDDVTLEVVKKTRRMTEMQQGEVTQNREEEGCDWCYETK